MTWGFLSTAHIVSLIVAAVIVFFFSLIVYKLNRKAQNIVLFIFSLYVYFALSILEDIKNPK